MVAIERYFTVTKAGSISLEGLPVQPGQRLCVRITVDEAGEAFSREDFRKLLEDTRRTAAPLTDAEIEEEIRAVRRLRRS